MLKQKLFLFFYTYLLHFHLVKKNWKLFLQFVESLQRGIHLNCAFLLILNDGKNQSAQDIFSFTIADELSYPAWK